MFTKVRQVLCEFGACGSSFGQGPDGGSGLKGYTNGVPDPVLFAAFVAAQNTMVSHHSWWHGHWCGYGGAGQPTDSTDSACQRHDYCYFANGVTADMNRQVFGVTDQQAYALTGCNQRLCTETMNGSWAGMNINIYFIFGSLRGCDGTTRRRE